MARWFFKLVYFTVSITSIVIICRLLGGQTYVRPPPEEMICNVTSNMTDAWPFKMRLTTINYICDIPEPNIDVADEDLIAALYLPPKTRLSPALREISRCEFAAKEMASKQIQFDTSQCHCVNSWPVFVLVSVACCAVLNLYRFIFGFAIDKKPGKDADDIFKLYIIAVVQFLCCWTVNYFLVILFDEGIVDLGLFYTRYGDMYPETYYSKVADWSITFKLLLVNYLITIIECSIYVIIEFGPMCIAEKLLAWINMEKPIVGSSKSLGSNAGVAMKPKLAI